MKTYFVSITDEPIKVLNGLPGKSDHNNNVVLDDELIPLSFSPGITESVFLNAIDKNNTSKESIVCLDGYINLQALEVQVDNNRKGNQESIIVYFRVRQNLDSGLCEIETKSKTHTPLLSEFQNEFCKSFIFVLRGDDYIKVTIGRDQFVFTCSSGKLEMYDVTTPAWPPKITHEDQATDAADESGIRKIIKKIFPGKKKSRQNPKRSAARTSSHLSCFCT